MDWSNSYRFFDSVEEIYDLLDQAGQAIRDIYNHSELSVEFKSDNSPVTAADIRSNLIITEGLNAMYNGIPILSEEEAIPDYSERKKWDYLWVLDPLDGTKGFINKNGEFTINLGLVLRDTVVAGFIYVPIDHRMYFAFKGMGAYHYQQNERHIRLHANNVNKQAKGIKVLVSRHHKDALTQSHIDTLNTPITLERGAALKFVSIASGEADYYPKMASIMEWDTAPGQILIEEAGGSVLDVDMGLPLRYNKPEMNNPFFIAFGKIIT